MYKFVYERGSSFDERVGRVEVSTSCGDMVDIYNALIGFFVAAGWPRDAVKRLLFERLQEDLENE